MKTNRIVFLAAAFLMSTKAFAGVGSSGGGKGVVCRDIVGAIQSVELLDLWEAKHIYGRSVSESPESLDVQSERAAKALMNSISIGRSCIGSTCVSEADTLYNELVETQKIFTSLNEDVKFLKEVTLALTDDSNEIATPNLGNCAIEQIVRYEDTPIRPTIFVNDDIYTAMSPTQKAALLSHEALYKVARNFFGEKTSIRVRRAIGGIFSNLKFVSRRDLNAKDRIICEYSGRSHGDTTQIELFHSSLATQFKSSAIVRVNYVRGYVIFGGLGLMASMSNPDLIAGLLKGEKPHSSKVDYYQTQSMIWEGGSTELSKWIHEIENETSLRFEYIRYKDGAIKMAVPTLESNAPLLPHPDFLQCRLPRVDEQESAR